MPYVNNGVSYPSVTTVLGILDKPALMPWASNCAVNYIADNLDKITNAKSPHDIEDLLKEARGAFRMASKEAIDIGSQVHSAIENYIKTGEDLKGDVPEAVQYGFLAFLEWEKKNKVKWLASELELFHDGYLYAGTCDVTLEMNGNKYIVDFKTSKDIYDEHKVQMAAYWLAYNNTHDEKIANTGILRLDKETGEPVFADTTFDMPRLAAQFVTLLDYYYCAKKRRLKNNPRVAEYDQTI